MTNDVNSLFYSLMEFSPVIIPDKWYAAIVAETSENHVTAHIPGITNDDNIRNLPTFTTLSTTSSRVYYRPGDSIIVVFRTNSLNSGFVLAGRTMLEVKDDDTNTNIDTIWEFRNGSKATMSNKDGVFSETYNAGTFTAPTYDEPYPAPDPKLIMTKIYKEDTGLTIHIAKGSGGDEKYIDINIQPNTITINTNEDKGKVIVNAKTVDIKATDTIDIQGFQTCNITGKNDGGKVNIKANEVNISAKTSASVKVNDAVGVTVTPSSLALVGGSMQMAL